METMGEVVIQVGTIKYVCDDDAVGLFWDRNESLADSTRPVVLLVHGTRNDCRTWYEYYSLITGDGDDRATLIMSKGDTLLVCGLFLNSADTSSYPQP